MYRLLYIQVNAILFILVVTRLQARHHHTILPGLWRSGNDRLQCQYLFLIQAVAKRNLFNRQLLFPKLFQAKKQIPRNNKRERERSNNPSNAFATIYEQVNAHHQTAKHHHNTAKAELEPCY